MLANHRDNNPKGIAKMNGVPKALKEKIERGITITDPKTIRVKTQITNRIKDWTELVLEFASIYFDRL